ncbi:ATPase [Candidatus Magnetomorum sp. HK-1]|nr:ATPase [Candidatus Magnetomorum sp. HK-1]
MDRDIYSCLKKWKTEKKRKPLIIRGARQVGKTWIVNLFGKQEFENMVEINLDFQPEFKSCFSNLNPADIIQQIELTSNTDIIPGKTLLFIDEIQECPQALKALRYLYEKKPELHIIAAGSLFEFIVDSEKITIPVGRVQYFFLFPLSFAEFLTACGENKLRNYLKNLSLDSNIPESIHEKCTSLLYIYLYLGGMPEAISHWLDTQKFSKVDETHQLLLQNYKYDFAKYGKRANIDMLEKVFSKTPAMVSMKFKYVHIDNHVNSREVKKALNLLIKAQVIQKIASTSGSGLPFSAYTNDKLFKAIFLDVGLLQNSMGISSETYMVKNIFATYKGLVAEQFVGQQLLTLKKHYEEPDLYYWAREAKGSSAEVDYLWQQSGNIIPIEVKAGKKGTLKSLKLFLHEKNAKFGIRLSLHPLSFDNQILSIPLFAIEAMPELIEQIITNL